MTRVTPYEGLPSLHISHDVGEVRVSGHWHENFEYSEEQNRGLDYREDLFNPFVLKCAIDRGEQVHLIASTNARPAADAPALRVREIRRRKDVLAEAPLQQPIVRKLVAATDQFIVNRGELKTIIAGYHWLRTGAAMR